MTFDNKFNCKGEKEWLYKWPVVKRYFYRKRAKKKIRV